MLDLPEGLDKIAAVRKAAFQPDLAGLEPGGAEQLRGFFHPELLDVLDGRDAQQLPEAAQTGALAEGHAARDLLHGQLLGVVLLHVAEHPLHPLGGDLFLLRDLGLPADTLGAQQPQRRREMIPHPVLVVERLIGHLFPRIPQVGQHLLLPRHGLVQQEKGRGTGLQQRADELLPEDRIHAAHQPGLEHAGVEQSRVLGLFDRVEHPGVEEHPLPGLQGQAGLVHIHLQRPLHREDILKLLVPVPRHRVAGQIFRIARDGKQRAAVLDQLAALGVGHDVRLAVDPAAMDDCCTARLICHIAQFLSAIL